MINQLAEIVHKNAREKGFYEEEKKHCRNVNACCVRSIGGICGCSYLVIK